MSGPPTLRFGYPRASSRQRVQCASQWSPTRRITGRHIAVSGTRLKNQIPLPSRITKLTTYPVIVEPTKVSIPGHRFSRSRRLLYSAKGLPSSKKIALHVPGSSSHDLTRESASTSARSGLPSSSAGSATPWASATGTTAEEYRQTKTTPIHLPLVRPRNTSSIMG